MYLFFLNVFCVLTFRISIFLHFDFFSPACPIWIWLNLTREGHESNSGFPFVDQTGIEPDKPTWLGVPLPRPEPSMPWCAPTRTEPDWPSCHLEVGSSRTIICALNMNLYTWRICTSILINGQGKPYKTAVHHKCITEHRLYTSITEGTAPHERQTDAYWVKWLIHSPETSTLWIVCDDSIRVRTNVLAGLWIFLLFNEYRVYRLPAWICAH